MRKIEDVTLKNGRNLKEVLELHKKWLEGEKGGEKANLSYEDLSDVDLNNLDLRLANLEGAILSYAKLRNVDLGCANLSYANLINASLRGANLSYANLSYANLINANLRGVYLRGVDLNYANLSIANLRGADLTGTDLTYINLTGANLIDADLTGVKYNNTTAFFELQCPEEGSFIGYKKANNKIVKLLITEDAKRSSATTRKCRCSKAKVLSITSLDGKENFEKVASDYDLNFIYEVGKIVEVKEFDENRWNEYSTGIHFFITRDEAVMYQKI